MPETIESFVERLRKEGLQVAQEEADQLLGQARKQADDILAEAGRQTEAILAAARAEAESIVAKGKTDLELAARDAVLALRESLMSALRAVLARGTQAVLQNGEFLPGLIHEVVLAYVNADLRGQTISLNISPELRQQGADWALRELAAKAGEHDMSIELQVALAKAGFEYTVRNATVEVTLDSVVEALSQMVAPALAEVVRHATEKA